jgi:hypothetical protein
MLLAVRGDVAASTGCLLINPTHSACADALTKFTGSLKLAKPHIMLIASIQSSYINILSHFFDLSDKSRAFLQTGLRPPSNNTAVPWWWGRAQARDSPGCEAVAVLQHACAHLAIIAGGWACLLNGSDRALGSLV